MDTEPIKIPKFVLRRGCKKGSKSRQLFWQDNGAPAQTVRISVVIPTPMAAKLKRFAELTGETQSQVVTSLIDNHAPDPGLIIPPPGVAFAEALTLDGRPDLWQRIQGGYLRPMELHRLRPFLARMNVTAFQLFRHWLRSMSNEALVRECGSAATSEESNFNNTPNDHDTE
jgi:hypothetical protein